MCLAVGCILRFLLQAASGAPAVFSRHSVPRIEVVFIRNNTKGDGFFLIADHALQEIALFFVCAVLYSVERNAGARFLNQASR